jgi:hypothetical protein
MFFFCSYSPQFNIRLKAFAGGLKDFFFFSNIFIDFKSHSLSVGEGQQTLRKKDLKNKF